MGKSLVFLILSAFLASSAIAQPVIDSEFGLGVPLNSIFFAMDYFTDSKCTVQYSNASTTVTSNKYCTPSVGGTYFTVFSRSAASSSIQGSFSCSDSACTKCSDPMTFRQGTCISLGTFDGVQVYGLPATVIPTTFSPAFFSDSACTRQSSSIGGVRPNICQKVPGAIGYFYLAFEVFTGNMSVASNCTTPSCTGCSFDYVSQSTCVPLGNGVYATFSAATSLSVSLLTLIFGLLIASFTFPRL